MHSVVHNCGHSTEQEPEVRKDEAVARQSKGKDTRGKIPQKSSSVPHVDLPPNKRTRQMPPSKCVCLCELVVCVQSTPKVTSSLSHIHWNIDIIMR